jgi:hypothetical protein
MHETYNIQNNLKFKQYTCPNNTTHVINNVKIILDKTKTI